jgi:hypothetical protein
MCFKDTPMDNDNGDKTKNNEWVIDFRNQSVANVLSVFFNKELVYIYLKGFKNKLMDIDNGDRENIYMV